MVHDRPRSEAPLVGTLTLYFLVVLHICTFISLSEHGLLGAVTALVIDWYYFYWLDKRFPMGGVANGVTLSDFTSDIVSLRRPMASMCYRFPGSDLTEAFLVFAMRCPSLLTLLSRNDPLDEVQLLIDHHYQSPSAIRNRASQIR